jgi:2-oxoglutarate ferredoxin oxidoreductase subunit beta
VTVQDGDTLTVLVGRKQVRVRLVDTKGEVPQHDGSIIKLRKLDADYDPSDKINAVSHIARTAEKGEVLTGLLYLAADAEDLHAHLSTVEMPFNKLSEKELCPGSSVLERLNASLR